MSIIYFIRKNCQTNYGTGACQGVEQHTKYNLTLFERRLLLLGPDNHLTVFHKCEATEATPPPQLQPRTGMLVTASQSSSTYHHYLDNCTLSILIIAVVECINIK